MTGKRVALVLGSGGARGYAHIGALRVLAGRGYEVVAIAGSSMGALVGGLYAAGRLDDYADWVGGLSQRDVIRLLDPALSGPGAIRLERVLSRVSEILDGALIEDLPIPFTAVATDLGARREVWFASGPVDVAVRASVAIPGLITPIMVNGRLLVDGGVLNPLPMDAILGVDADFTMAISLGGERSRGTSWAPAKETSAQRPPNEWLDRFTRSAAGVWQSDFVASILARFPRPAQDTDTELQPAPPAFEPPPPGLGITDVTSMSLDAMSALITRLRLALLPPDVMVTVPVDAARSIEFHRAHELIELGERLTEQALDGAFGEDAVRELESGPAAGGDDNP